MSGLFDRLSSDLKNFTQADRVIANYILANRQTISFETAVSLAQKIGVTPITVGRFCRKLGYKNFKDFKQGLKSEITSGPWLKGKELKEFIDLKSDKTALQKSLKLEIQAMVEVYQLTETDTWSEVTSLLANKEKVFIVGFQPERAISCMLASLLQYIRPNVTEVNTVTGHYAEVLLDAGKDTCLVIVDIHRYSTHAYQLAERANQLKIPTVIITDKKCGWGRRFTPYTLMAEREVGLFWTSSVSMVCLVNLLINDVVKELGVNVEKRLANVSALYQDFVGHLPSGKN